MKMSLKAIRVLAIMLVMVLSISAVSALITGSPAVGTASAADREGIVHVGWLSEVVNWNPLAIEMVEDYVVCYLIYSALFTYDQDWNGPVNDLATGYYFDVDESTGVMTTYINITDTAYFRNAANPTDTTHPLTAEDVAFSFQTMKDNPGGAFDWYLEEVSNITVVSPTQVSMDTPYAKATLIDDISSLPIIPKYIWETDKTPLGSMSPEEMVGSGPFMFDDYVKGSWYRFLTAPNYHGSADYDAARTVSIEGILYTVYTATTALTTAVNTGEEDFVVLTGDMRSFLEDLGEGASVNVFKAAVQEPGICDIAINAIPASFVTPSYGTHHAALDDPNVRKAIMMTLNKADIVDVMLKGYATIGSSVVQPGDWQADIQNQLPYDPAGAKQWLMDHGWNEDEDGDGFLEAAAGNAYNVPEGTELSGIRCQAPDTDPTYGTIADAWKGWADDAGISLTSTTESEITMINIAWYKADYDIWVWHWGWGPEPIGGALSCWLTSEIEEGGDNCQTPMGPWWFDDTNCTAAGFDGPYSAFDQNMSLAMNTLDREDRGVIVDKLQQWVYDSYCENPPFYDLGLYGYSDQNFDNWGDVAGHSGLSVASDLLWIWFNVKEVTNRAPVYNVPLEDSYVAYVGDSKDFSVSVSDAEGDTITVTFDWGDGTTPYVETVAGATEATEVIVSHEYTAEDIYDLTVSITDGFVDPVTTEPREPILSTAIVEVQTEPNDVPEITSMTSVPSTKAYIGDDTDWSITATDTELWAEGVKVTWDWDDGTFDVEEPTPVGNLVTSTMTHSWSVPDVYYVTASVFDMHGNTEDGQYNVSNTRTYTIVVNQPPTDPVIQDIFGIALQSVPCAASSSDADGDTLTFTWEWDDGTYTVESIPTTAGATVTSEVDHIWDTAGTYEVTVYVDDGNDNNVSGIGEAVIGNPGDNVPPGSFALALTPDPVYVDVETTFDVSASDANEDVLTMTIDFGDESDLLSDTTDGGTTGAQHVEFTHTYAEVGEYTVTVYADDGSADGNKSATFTIDVTEAPENAPPTLEMASDYSATWNVSKRFAPLTITDEDEDELTVWYSWGDDTAMTMGDPDDGYGASHTYMETGTFTLTVYADDGMGHNVTDTADVKVDDANTKPTVESITATPNPATAGDTVMFTVTVTDLEGGSITVKIEFGEGTEESKVVVLEAKQSLKVYFNHTYDESDIYTVNATAEDGLDHADSVPSKKVATLTVDSKGISMMLVGGIAIAVIAAIAAAALLMKRKKKGGAETIEGSSGMEGMAAPEEPPPPQA